MAKTTKRNRKPVQKVDILNLPEGVYLDEKGFGEIHPLTVDEDDFGEREYIYRGTLHKGALAIVTGKKLTITVPMPGYDHGYTFEGAAQEIFKVENALNVTNPAERRTFSYINPHSQLTFFGDPKQEYEIHFHIYDNCKGENNFRWVVVRAELY